jgi:hypothetical protein
MTPNLLSRTLRPYGPLRRRVRGMPGYWALRRLALTTLAAVPGMPLPMKVWPHTMVANTRLRSLMSHAEAVCAAEVPGAFVECGVALGGTALLLATMRSRLDPSRELWLFDSFEGLPPPSERDPDYDAALKWTGKCRGELHEIRALIARHGEQAHYVKGWYDHTIPISHEPRQIALLHLDADWYDSTTTCLKYLWPRVSVGGRVQFDDYGTWQGCAKAVGDFFGSTVKLHVIDNAGAWLEKSREMA